MGSDPVRSIDTADAPITQKRNRCEVELAHQRIELVRQLLQMVEPKRSRIGCPIWLSSSAACMQLRR